jgi:hypothetical protein
VPVEFVTETAKVLAMDQTFLADFKAATEARWSTHAINPEIYGFQFQPSTRWLPGLSTEQIKSYERALGIAFPDDLREFLAYLNGTDLPTINAYGRSGQPEQYSVGVYSYPRDLELVLSRIKRVRQNWPEIEDDLRDQGFHLATQADLLPIYSHRYVVCNSR